MLIVDRNDNAKPIQITLNGVIDDTIGFADHFGDIAAPTRVSCQNVRRINSIGIKNWCEYFNAVRKKGVVLRFAELSPPLVSAMNYLNGFIMKDEVESIVIPYHCEACNSSSSTVGTPEEISAGKVGQEEIKCPSCGAMAEFDELKEEYFSFLRPSK